MKHLLFLLTSLVAFGCPAHKSPDSYMQKASGHPVRTKAVWKTVAPGIWKSDIGTPEAVDLLDMAGITTGRSFHKGGGGVSVEHCRYFVRGSRWEDISAFSS
jgi:hypothetical protein